MRPASVHQLAIAMAMAALLPESETTAQTNISAPDPMPVPRKSEPNPVVEAIREERRRRKHNAWLKRQPKAEA